MSCPKANKLTINSFFPIINWLKVYKREDFNYDLFAGLISSILMVPQGIAYAILAGLPVQLGLYASILPPLLYVVFGTSRIMSVGPASISAIMIASALNAPEISILGDQTQSALVLSAECGIIMLVMAVFRMGGLVNFISNPVLSGFTTGASILIIASQLPQTIGLKTSLCGFNPDCFSHYLQTINYTTVAISAIALALLLFFSELLEFLLKKTRLKVSLITAISKCGPLLIIILATASTSYFDLGTAQKVATVGFVPSGFPVLELNFFNTQKWQLLLPYAVFIALISYVSSVAIAKVTAKFTGEKIEPDQELIALGAANLMSSFSGGMPVAGGLSRTMVNYAAGARTQIATLIVGCILALVAMFIGSWFANIPKAVLAIIIIVSVVPLVRIKSIFSTWRYDPGDGIAETSTLLGVLVLGLEQGLAVGFVITLISYLRKTSHPYIAVLGRIPNTEQYRNINRYKVETWEHLLLLRIDENISFANVSYIEDYLSCTIKQQPAIKHIILIFASVSDIDSTGLEVLEDLNRSLQESQITVHISDAKGPVIKKLKKTDFLEQLKPGKVFMSTHDAVKELC